MPRHQLISNCEDDTLSIGRQIGALVPRGTFIALFGDHTAGKTMLVRGIAHGLDVPAWAALRSPARTLMLSYHGGRHTLHHVDFYHLNQAPELPERIQTALHEPDAVCVVEWADVFKEIWPERGLISIQTHFCGDDQRIDVIEDNECLLPDLAQHLEPWIVQHSDHDTDMLAIAGGRWDGSERRHREPERRQHLSAGHPLYGERRHHRRRGA